MPPHWLTILAYVWLGLAGVSTIILVVLVVRRPSKMAVMNAVWPITGLYMGPFALWAYAKMSKPKQDGRDQQMQGGDQEQGASSEQGGGQGQGASEAQGGGRGGTGHGSQKSPPSGSAVFKGATHCGAGCTLGDIVGEVIVALAALEIAASPLWPRYILDYILAFIAGIAFQYFSIVPMRQLKPLPGIWAAVKADTLSITAFEVGMFGWMAISYFVLFDPPLKPSQPAFLFMMQIAMMIGFATTLPMNWWLIKRGLKEAM